VVLLTETYHYTENQGFWGAAYAAERLLFSRNFFKPQNPRLINESGFKLRAAYDGTCTIVGKKMT
jgi:hypothetical protein